jgi:hypothetical protein
LKPTDPDHQRLLERYIEEDTRVLVAEFIRVEGIPILLESWSGGGVKGMRAVFLTETVAGMDDAALENFLADHGVDLGGGVTILRREANTFVSFAFTAT